MSKLHHTLHPISSVAATSAATGYPASNVTTPEVRKPWRSSGITTQNLDIDLGTARTAPVLCLQGVNAASCTVSYGTVAYTTTSAGTLSLSRDRHGRRKGSIALSGSVRYVRLVFGAAVPDDSAAFFELGSVLPFASTLSLAEPMVGASSAEPVRALERPELPNGAPVVFTRGVTRQHLSLRFRVGRTEDLDQLVRLAQRQVCWLDLDIAANRELQWPVRHLAERFARSFATATQDESTVELEEVA